MKILLRIIALLLLSPLLIVGKILGWSRREIEYLPEEHPEMAKAIAEARATLSGFRSLLGSPEPGMANFAVKARFPVPGGGSEHCWVGELETRGTGFSGKLTNQPQQLHTLALGSMVDVTENMVSDWAYSKDGVYHGHFTTKILLPRMSKKFRRRVEQLYGWSNQQSSDSFTTSKSHSP